MGFILLRKQSRCNKNYPFHECRQGDRYRTPSPTLKLFQLNVLLKGKVWCRGLKASLWEHAIRLSLYKSKPLETLSDIKSLPIWSTLSARHCIFIIMRRERWADKFLSALFLCALCDRTKVVECNLPPGVA